ncbi:MAG TPA: hypothetical protein VE270_04240 [Thermoleophilaceae bacterium]|nr:hypothetical protein [Thermoleophilaceae bacterium]
MASADPVVLGAGPAGLTERTRRASVVDPAAWPAARRHLAEHVLEY